MDKITVGSPATATAASGAVTLHARKGKVTSEALTTATAADYTLTITNKMVRATDMVLASVAYGTTSQGTPVVTRAKCSNGSIQIIVKNDHASNALNGTIIVSFVIL